MAISFKLGSKPKDDTSSSIEKLPLLQDSAHSAPETEPPAPIGRDRRILVVDDNEVVLKAFEMKLRASGFKVFTTPKPGDVASCADECKAELILLDINFSPPGYTAMEWNGFGVIQWLRRFPELASIPVILMSGADSAKCEEKALASGAVAFFSKPVDYPKLLATILQYLGDKPA
jgi:two-component system cell cycle response regulator DivK